MITLQNLQYVEIPDEIKGEVIIAFVVLKQNTKKSEDVLRAELIQTIRNGNWTNCNSTADLFL